MCPKLYLVPQPTLGNPRNLVGCFGVRIHSAATPGMSDRHHSRDFVDLPLIHVTVESLLRGKRPTPHATPTTTSPVLTSGQGVERHRSPRAGKPAAECTGPEWLPHGRSRNTPHTAARLSREVPLGADPEASALASTLGGLTPQQSASVPAGTLNVIIGTSFTMPTTLGTGTAGSRSTSVPARPRPCPQPAAAEPALRPTSSLLCPHSLRQVGNTSGKEPATQWRTVAARST